MMMTLGSIGTMIHRTPDEIQAQATNDDDQARVDQVATDQVPFPLQDETVVFMSSTTQPSDSSSYQPSESSSRRTSDATKNTAQWLAKTARASVSMISATAQQVMTRTLQGHVETPRQSNITSKAATFTQERIQAPKIVAFSSPPKQQSFSTIGSPSLQTITSPQQSIISIPIKDFHMPDTISKSASDVTINSQDSHPQPRVPHFIEETEELEYSITIPKALTELNTSDITVPEFLTDTHDDTAPEDEITDETGEIDNKRLKSLATTAMNIAIHTATVTESVHKKINTHDNNFKTVGLNVKAINKTLAGTRNMVKQHANLISYHGQASAHHNGMLLTLSKTVEDLVNAHNTKITENEILKKENAQLYDSLLTLKTDFARLVDHHNKFVAHQSHINKNILSQSSPKYPGSLKLPVDIQQIQNTYDQQLQSIGTKYKGYQEQMQKSYNDHLTSMTNRYDQIYKSQQKEIESIQHMHRINIQAFEEQNNLHHEALSEKHDKQCEAMKGKYNKQLDSALATYNTNIEKLVMQQEEALDATIRNHRKEVQELTQVIENHEQQHKHLTIEEVKQDIIKELLQCTDTPRPNTITHALCTVYMTKQEREEDQNTLAGFFETIVAIVNEILRGMISKHPDDERMQAWGTLLMESDVSKTIPKVSHTGGDSYQTFQFNTLDQQYHDNESHSPSHPISYYDQKPFTTPTTSNLKQSPGQIPHHASTRPPPKTNRWANVKQAPSNFKFQYNQNNQYQYDPYSPRDDQSIGNQSQQSHKSRGFQSQEDEMDSQMISFLSTRISIHPQRYKTRCT